MGQSSHFHRLFVIRGENVSKFSHGENVSMGHRSAFHAFAELIVRVLALASFFIFSSRIVP